LSLPCFNTQFPYLLFTSDGTCIPDVSSMTTALFITNSRMQVKELAE
jgi:hypothetical protein